MKIDKEEFNKLNQLDRIEFRQRLEYINDNTLIMGGLILSGLFGIKYFLSSFIFFLILGGLIMIIVIKMMFQSTKKTKELKKEYFEAKVK